MPDTVLVKLGGSLITDKRRPETARPAEIARLADEIAAAWPTIAGHLVLGHGSGSFGHVVAERHGLTGGATSPDQLPGVAATQRGAARLHHRLLAALDRAGLAPFSVAPSSSAVADGGRIASFAVEPVARALKLGLLPVLYGDVVLDRSRGASICSTETVFEALAEHLPPHGYSVERILWLGETRGVYDGSGATIPEITPATPRPSTAGAAAGHDVTGGMAHRVERALALAARGIPSQIADGRQPGLLSQALAGQAVDGTRIVP